MSQENARKIRLIYGIALSVLLIVTGVLLMISCVNIYRIGPRPFTTENISNAFDKIAIPVFITVGAVAVGAILQLVLPNDKKKPRASIDKKATISKLEKKISLAYCSQETVECLENIKKKQTLLTIAVSALCIAAAIPTLFFALNKNSYTADYNASVKHVCVMILPWLLVVCGLLIAYSYIEEMLLTKRLSLTKEAMAQSKGHFPVDEQNCKKCNCQAKKIWLIRAIVLVVTIGILAVGIFGDGMADVLAKAVNICTECIGLG